LILQFYLSPEDGILSKSILKCLN